MMDRFILSSELEQLTASENPLRSLHDTIAFDSADWGADKTLAWIYGIVLGWDDDPDDPDPEPLAMSQIAATFGWSDERVARLRRLHTEFVALDALFVRRARERDL